MRRYGFYGVPLLLAFTLTSPVATAADNVKDTKTPATSAAPQRDVKAGDNASAFIRANMPLGQGGTLTDQQAWDVATFMNSQERPQDPRFTGNVVETRRKFHDNAFSMYGKTVNGKVLGSGR